MSNDVSLIRAGYRDFVAIPSSIKFAILLPTARITPMARAVIGSPEALTTVTAQNIIIEEGATVHGAVWAHEIGMVKSE